MKGGGRFKKSTPVIPGKKRYLPPRPNPSSPSPIHVDLENHDEQQDDEGEDEELIGGGVENKYFRFTSLRMLVWINFALILVLTVSFFIYAMTRPSIPPPLSTIESTTEDQSREESEEKTNRIAFNLVPDKESNEKWVLLSLKSSDIDTSSINRMWVCCTKHDIYSCDGYDVLFYMDKKEAKISIRHPDKIGATCRLYWSRS